MKKENDVIIRVFPLPYEDRKRHKLYRQYGKVGTTCRVVLYFIDKIPTEINEYCYFIEENSNIIRDGIKKINPYVLTNLVRTGYVDKINYDDCENCNFYFIKKT